MSNRTQGYQYTMKDYLKIFIAFALLGGLIFFCLKLAFIPKEVVTDSQVWDVLVLHGYTPVDYTEQYIKSNPTLGISKNITIEKDDWQLEFFTFEEPKYAMKVYSKFATDMSQIERNHHDSSIETRGSRANFEYHTLEAGEYSKKIYYLMRIDNTVLYAYGNEEYADEIKSIAKELGYVGD